VATNQTLTSRPDSQHGAENNIDNESYRFDDWSRLVGATVEVRSEGSSPQTGFVDAASADGTIVWLCQAWPPARFLVEKAEGDEIWISPNQLRAESSAICHTSTT
jgi:hypothetical protein